ncbi:MAG TPA: hypothetical protein ENK91_14790 [Bacteroidetes bacterium]|nr:hypothetical protein [Bacteroidota bacterium]
MKTTKVADVTKWLVSNKKHLNDLKDGFSEGIEWAGHKINYSKARLDIYMPKDIYIPSRATAWKNYLKELCPELDFNISTLEKYKNK